MESPEVSVCVITYNHSKYIQAAMDSVLQQKMVCKWELIVADDYSTDGTREILKEYRARHPDLIKLLLQERNVGAGVNFFDLLGAASGKYIAYLEGDDFWLSTDKLNNQLNALEGNDEFVMCVHNTKMVKEGDPDNFQVFRPDWTKCDLAVLTLEDQIRFNLPYHSSSVFFRNVIKEYPKFLYDAISGDIALFTVIAEKGKIFYLDKVLSVRREHAAGISKLNEKNQELKFVKRIKMYKDLDSYFNHRYSYLYKSFIYRNLSRLFLLRIRSSAYSNAANLVGDLYRYSENFTTFCNLLFRSVGIGLKGLVRGYVFTNR